MYWLNCKTCDVPLCNVMSDTKGELLGEVRQLNAAVQRLFAFRTDHAGHELEEREQ